MKRVLLISLAIAMSVTACSEKTSLALKARTMKDTQKAGPGTGNDTATNDPSSKVDGSSPDNADNRKLLLKEKSVRNIKIGSDSVQTTISCNENIAKAEGETERIKIQGGGQMMTRQVVTMPSPENTNSKNPKQNPKALISFVCSGVSADLNKEAQNKNIMMALLENGKTVAVVGKFSNASDDTLTAVIGCANAKTMEQGASILLPSEASKNTVPDILLLENTKIIFETVSKDKDAKKYIMVVCDKAVTAPTPPAAADTSSEDTPEDPALINPDL